MKTMTESEYNAINKDYRGVWTTERTDQADWAAVRHLHMGKRTILSYDNKHGTCLLIEGSGLTIVPDAVGVAA
jgi:hypothetical protein